ncbi:MAG: His/Gly/Thr/Pro-type tRNA ligase C-terminal domain-containing protein, partial [Pseudomonadota bacterium]
NPGEGAFYGPKLEFVLRDAIGRDWQCGTLQVDFVLPERLDAHYIDAAGEKCCPVMLHRAILGSFERFIGILIEHYAGRLPLWLAPVQLVVASISEAGEAWVHEVCHAMQQAGLRVEADVRAEKIGYKIREHETGKIPVIGIVGKHECDDRTVTLRYGGGSGKPVQEKLTLAEAIEQISTKAQFPC